MKIPRFLLLLTLVALLASCSTTPSVVVPGPKVQTFHELMVKLKKGFDEGTLDTPEFYAKELGYPLERPGELKTIPSPYPPRKIAFDSGELKGAVAYVGPGVTKEGQEGKKMVQFKSNSTLRPAPGRGCIMLADVQAVWGVVDPRELEIWTTHHAPIPVRFFEYKKGPYETERWASAQFFKNSSCMHALIVGQFYK